MNLFSLENLRLCLRYIHVPTINFNPKESKVAFSKANQTFGLLGEGVLQKDINSWCELQAGVLRAHVKYLTRLWRKSPHRSKSIVCTRMHEICIYSWHMSYNPYHILDWQLSIVGLGRAGLINISYLYILTITLNLTSDEVRGCTKLEGCPEREVWRCCHVPCAIWPYRGSSSFWLWGGWRR